LFFGNVVLQRAFPEEWRTILDTQTTTTAVLLVLSTVVLNEATMKGHRRPGS
jgi:hypothetical protein